MRFDSGSDIRPGIRRLFQLAVRRDAFAHAELEEEIRLHLELRTAQLIREGSSPEAAQAEAERRWERRGRSFCPP